jgi:hypothetical protein
MKMIVKYAFVLYDVEIAYDSSFDYNVNVIGSQMFHPFLIPSVIG